MRRARRRSGSERTWDATGASSTCTKPPASWWKSKYDGRVPSDPDELIRLPGIGPYTAGAVACFAYERDAVFLDTDMRRVLRRVLHRLFLGLKPATSATDKELLAIAEELAPPGRGWRWNQALMETGALICNARSPRCDECSALCTRDAAPGWRHPRLVGHG